MFYYHHAMETLRLYKILNNRICKKKNVKYVVLINETLILHCKFNSLEYMNMRTSRSLYFRF